MLKLQLRFILPSNPPSSWCEKQHGSRPVSAGAQRPSACREAVAVPLILLVLTFLCSEPKAVKQGMLACSWLHGNIFGASAQRSGLEKAAIQEPEELDCASSFAIYQEGDLEEITGLY